MSRVFVVILNWNGGTDTLECLASLSRQSYRDCRVVVIDNGSSDDSVARIKAWAEGKEDVVMIENGDNLGFAAGCNVGIRLALAAGADHVLLLNNDTVVEPDAIARLVSFLNDHPDYAGATGQIRYFGRDVIWNCGGDLTWFGSRRYVFGDQPIEAAPSSGWRRITFITGCAALIRSSVFSAHGLLTERFFFGEEDYEFSLRLRRANLRLACCFDAVIHHKVGSSIDEAAPATGLGRYYVYYLNRFIDMRAYYPAPWWWVWRWLTLALVLPRLRGSRGLPWRGLIGLGRRLLADSRELDGVSRERFETATRSGLDALRASPRGR